MDGIWDAKHDGAIRIPAAFLVRQYPILNGYGIGRRRQRREDDAP